jgi:hypothetical protein
MKKIDSTGALDTYTAMFIRRMTLYQKLKRAFEQSR